MLIDDGSTYGARPPGDTLCPVARAEAVVGDPWTALASRRSRPRPGLHVSR